MATTDLIYVKTNIGGYFFDAFLRQDHSSELEITDHPVQSGSNISDHAFMKPRELTLELGMTEAFDSIVPGQFADNYMRSVSAFRLLQDLQRTAQPLRILTRLQLYENMILQRLSAPDDYITRHALKCTATFREIIVPEVKTVAISAAPQVTDTTNRGQVQTDTPNRSVAAQIFSMLTGGG